MTQAASLESVSREPDSDAGAATSAAGLPARSRAIPASRQTTSVADGLSRPLSSNERRVLALLRPAPLARAELARLTGLSAQAMTGIVRGLVAGGLLRALPPVRGRVGQPSVPLALDPRGALALGCTIGRRGAECALVDLAGGLVERRSRAWRWPELDVAMGFAVEASTALAARVPRERLHGLGVSMPGELWQWHERLGAPRAALERWREHDVAAALASATGLTVRLGNDAAAACGAELTYGSGAELGHFAYFSVGFFVGGGLVIDGAVHAGHHGRGAAFGSLPVPGAPLPGAGRTAQLIDEASVHVLETMLERAGHGADAAALAAADATTWSEAPEIVERWERRAATALATAIASVVAVVDLDHVVVDGALPAHVRVRLCSRVRAALERVDTRGLVLPPVVEGTLGRAATVLGAARLALLDTVLPTRQPSTAA